MAINKIITEKTLNYIETLYLYANIEDFIEYTSTSHDWLLGEPKENGQLITLKDIQNTYESIKYTKMMEYTYDNLLSTAQFLGHSSGRDWYKLPNYRIGIMDFDKAKRSNQFNVQIQYEQSHMFTLNPNLNGLDLPFDGDFSQYHIHRIDVCQIVKTPTDYLTSHNFISPYRVQHSTVNCGKTETVYLGHRKSGNVMRMYNKSIELNTDTKDHPINYKKIEMFGQYFGDIEDLYTFELELHRKYLKPTFGIDTLSDLPLVYKAYHDIAGKIKIYEDTDENKNHIKNKDHDRIKDCFKLTDYKEFKRIPTKRYKPSENHLVKKVIKQFNAFDKSLVKPMKEHEKLILLDKILSGILMASDVSIELNDDEHEDMFKKFEDMRDGQDDQLFKESVVAFAPMNAQKADDVF
jgi:hypothetical protein